ncbi:MAG: hypothetical protein LBG21_02990 [Campylobacteraceae bacterium]|nr:hypothetical protein [Campylobacteraceae bacterium]
MIRPKGFGKKYFTLSSIQAHSCAAKLHSRLVSVHLFFVKTNKDKEPSDKDDPPPKCNNLLEYSILHYYNFFFLKCTQKISKAKKAFCKFCSYSYYGFCRSGIHPPKTLLIQSLKQNLKFMKG